MHEYAYILMTILKQYVFGGLKEAEGARVGRRLLVMMNCECIRKD